MPIFDSPYRGTEVDRAVARALAEPLSVKDPSIGATGDGATDDTAAFLAIETLIDGDDLVIFAPAGIYILNGLEFTKNVTIYGEPGTVFTRNDATKNVLRFLGSGKTIKLFDIIIDGASIHKTGVLANNCDTFIAERVIVRDCGIPGYAHGHAAAVDGFSLVNIEHVYLDRCEFYRCERDGVLGWPIRHSEFTRCYSEDCGRGGLVCDRNVNSVNPNDGGPKSVIMIGNRIVRSGAIGLYAEAHADDTANLTKTGTCDVVFADNKVIDCGHDDWGFGYGIVMGNNCRGQIHDNTVVNFGIGSSSTVAACHAIQVGDYTGDVTIHDNIVSNPRCIGIFVNNTSSSSYQINIHHNHIKTPGSTGIYVYDAPRTILDCNQIWTGNVNGIIVNLSNGTKLLSNIVKDCSQSTSNASSGIYILDSLGAQILGGEVNGARHKYGIEFAGSTTVSNLRGMNITQFVTGALSTFTASATLIAYDNRLMVGSTVDTGFYQAAIYSADANALFLQRPLTNVNNTFRILFASTVTGGITLDFLSGSTPSRLHYISGNNTNLTFFNASDFAILSVNYSNSFVGIRTTSPAYRFDVDSGDIRIRSGNLRWGGTSATADATVIDAVGSGSPEGVVPAGIGSIYRRTDGGALTSFYVKESGTGNTGWVAK